MNPWTISEVNPELRASSNPWAPPSVAQKQSTVGCFFIAYDQLKFNHEHPLWYCEPHQEWSLRSYTEVSPECSQVQPPNQKTNKAKAKTSKPTLKIDITKCSTQAWCYKYHWKSLERNHMSKILLIILPIKNRWSWVTRAYSFNGWSYILCAFL